MRKIAIIDIGITLALGMANSIISQLLLIWINLKSVLLHRKRLVLEWIVATQCRARCLMMIGYAAFYLLI